MKFLSPQLKKFLLLLLKLLVVGGAFYFIKNQLTEKDFNWDIISQTLQKPNAWILVSILLLLTFFNRFLEILKWQNLAKVVKPISIWESTKQVLIGITFGIVTPNGIGEYAGKAWFYDKKDAVKIVFLNAVCNGIQVIFSVTFGLIGTLYINSLHQFIDAEYILLFFGILIAVILVILLVKNIRIKGYSLQTLFKSLNEIPKKTIEKTLFWRC